MPPSTPNPDVFDQELVLLYAAADDFHNPGSPGPNTPGEKRSSPDDDEDHNSGSEDETNDTSNENEAGLE